MAEKVTVPDLRFEQSFLARLRIAANRKAQKQRSKHLGLREDGSEPLEKDKDPSTGAPITLSTVISTITKDQVLLPLAQGFLFALMRITVFPWIRWVFGFGRSVGGSISGHRA